jgi:hypothetical protein
MKYFIKEAAKSIFKTPEARQGKYIASGYQFAGKPVKKKTGSATTHYSIYSIPTNKSKNTKRYYKGEAITPVAARKNALKKAIATPSDSLTTKELKQYLK